MRNFRATCLATALAFLGFAAPAMAQGTCAGTDLVNTLPPDLREDLTAQAQAMPYGTGLLWQATRGDTVIDIFGTYHFQHAQTEAHLDRVKPLIEAADKIYLEISNDDQAAMQRAMAEDPSIMFITEGPTLPDLLGEDDWQAYAKQMADRQIPGFMAAKFKPLWAGMMLGIGPCEARSGAMQAKGIDARVGEHAASIGNPTRSLEDFRDLLTLIDSFPDDDQLNMIRMSLAWPGNTDDLSYTIRERYLAGDIAMTLVFSRYISEEYGGQEGADGFEMVEDLLLEKRNTDWITRLEAEITPGDRVFLAFGAGHLPGEIGVLRLLENAGYTITQVPL